MAIDLREMRLPGVGVKYTFNTAAGSRVTVIQHNDGDRELYIHRRPRDDDPAIVLELHDDEARQLGAVLGGAYERPRIIEELELALGELHDRVGQGARRKLDRSGRRSASAASDGGPEPR